MEFKLILHPGANFATTLESESACGRYPEYDAGLDDIRSILIDVCDALQESTPSKFTVSGFGLKWPVEVYPELCILLEQLPDAIAAAKSNDPFQIYFYEQGVSRIVEFVPNCDFYSVSCTDSFDKAPLGKSERISSSELLDMLCGIRDNFLTFVKKEAHKISVHPWIVDHFSDSVNSVKKFR